MSISTSNSTYFYLQSFWIIYKIDKITEMVNQIEQIDNGKVWHCNFKNCDFHIQDAFSGEIASFTSAHLRAF